MISQHQAQVEHTHRHHVHVYELIQCNVIWMKCVFLATGNNLLQSSACSVSGVLLPALRGFRFS
jgi:hypothetical protein